MSGLRKLGDFLSTVVKVLFWILMMCILFATVGIDKNNSNQFPNTVTLDNGIYFLGALLLLEGLLWLLYARRSSLPAQDIRRESRLTMRVYYGSLVAMAFVVAVLQYFVSRWMPNPSEYFSSDFKNVMNGAWELAHGGSLQSFSYFKRSPNNLNMTIVLSFLYRLFPYRRAAILVGALLTNVSVVLTSLSVYNITKREGIALTVAGIGEVLVALTWRAFLPYTDNYGMALAALMLLLYTTDLKPEIKYPLITLFAAILCYIKITGIIVFLAIVVNGLVNWMRSGERKLNYKRMALYAGCVIVMFGAVFGLQGPIRRHYGFDGGGHPKGWQYLFMVGQNTKKLGNVDKSNHKLRDAYIKKYDNMADLNQAFLNKAFSYIAKRGFWGNLVFYENKINVAYNDGYFNNYQTKSITKMEQTFLYNVYIRKGKYYQVGAVVLQILWDAVLLTMIAYVLCEGIAFRRRRRANGIYARFIEMPSVATDPERYNSFLRFLKIGILGITLYLLCFEGRSKYLYMFLPLYLAAFAVMFDRICDTVTSVEVRK